MSVETPEIGKDRATEIGERIKDLEEMSTRAEEAKQSLVGAIENGKYDHLTSEDRNSAIESTQRTIDGYRSEIAALEKELGTLTS
ncbi:MAG TPA: hypothetical protein VGC58_00310 [Candidatus Paceibacterota bacterium]